MNNYKIKVNGSDEFKEATKLFQQLGFEWVGAFPECCDWFSHLYVKEEKCSWLPVQIWNELAKEYQELTLPQLRDLVAQSNSKVREYLDPNDNYKLCLINPSDAAHWMIEVPEGAQKYLSGEAFITSGPITPFFYKKSEGKAFEFYENEWCAHPFDLNERYFENILWSREPIQEQGLISGADALRALADGQLVQYSFDDDKYWQADIANLKITDFGSGHFQFRLKPRTIKLELEIPAPFDPKDGEEAWCLDGLTLNGYKKIIGDIFVDPGIGFWRTEEEIKQVVAALRGGIKG